MPDLGTISVYLEPTKRKLTLDLQDGATIGDVVQGMVTHLRTAEQFDVEHFLREKIGDGYAPEWQLFRENENMQLLPPDARFADLQPPLDRDEMFTLKVNARVAAADLEPNTDPPMEMHFSDQKEFVAQAMVPGDVVRPPRERNQRCKQTLVLSARAIPGDPCRLTLREPEAGAHAFPCKVANNGYELELAPDCVVQFQKMTCILDGLPTTEDSIYFRMLEDPGTKLRIQQDDNLEVIVPGPLMGERELPLFWVASGKLRFTILPGLGMEPPRNQQWPIRLTLEGETNRALGGPNTASTRFKTMQGPVIDLTGDKPTWVSHDPGFTERLISVLTQHRIGFTISFCEPDSLGCAAEHATFSFPEGAADKAFACWNEVAKDAPAVVRD